MRRVRGGDIALIFQEPMTSFSPVHTVGSQMIETIRLHQSLDKRVAREKAIEMFRLVGIPREELRQNGSTLRARRCHVPAIRLSSVVALLERARVRSAGRSRGRDRAVPAHRDRLLEQLLRPARVAPAGTAR